MSGSDTLRLCPVVSDYPLYDKVLYDLMTGDKPRDAAFRGAVSKLVNGKTVVDIGTGRDVNWARASVEAGARKVFAIEEMPETCRMAQQTVRLLGLENLISVISGNSMDVELPERVDVCVSEVIGCIGSSEGVVSVFKDARERFLKPEGRIIPWRCVTRLALVELPDQFRSSVAFDGDAEMQAARIFQWVGHRFDLRVAIEGSIDLSWFISNVDDVEVIDLASPTFPAARKFELRVERAGKVDGMLAWHNLWCLPGGECLDTRDASTTAWMPIWLPVLYPGIELRPGDRVTGVWTPSLSSDGRHPDYALLAEVHRDTAPPSRYELHLPHHAPRYRCSEFHRHIFRGLDGPAWLNSA